MPLPMQKRERKVQRRLATQNNYSQAPTERRLLRHGRNIEIMCDKNESLLAIREMIFGHLTEEYPWYKRDSKSIRKVKRQEQRYRSFIDSYLNLISTILKRKIYDDFFHAHSKCIESSQVWFDLQKRLNTSTNQGILVSFKTSLERNAYTLNFLTKRA